MTEPLQGTVVPQFDPKDIQENKAVACLSYIWILFLIPLLAKKESKFCQEHAKQGMVMCITWIIGSFVFWFPLFGQLLFFVLLIATVLAFVKCIQGEFWEVPVLGAFRHKFNI